MPDEYQFKERVGLSEFSHLMVGAGPLSSLGEELKLEFVERVENVSDLIIEESNRIETASNILNTSTVTSSTTGGQSVLENKDLPQYNVNREELIRSLP